MDYAPTLASAQRAHRTGELAAWCQIWLRGEGASVGLADPLRARDDDVYVLAEVDLGDVYPITGPEPDFDWPEPPDEYERQVERMTQALRAGWDAPPLFVHMHTLRLVDGSHRREALLRTGRRTYWAVMFCCRPPFNGRGQDVSLNT